MSFDDIFNSNIGMLDLLTPTISVASTESGVTVSITDKNGLKQYTLTNGVHVSGATINGNGELVLTLSDGQTINAGNAKGANGTNGTNGVSITNVQVNALGHLVCTLSNGQTIDAGSTVGETAVSSVNGKTGTVVLTASDVGAATASDIATAVSSKQDTINDLSTIRSGASAGATALQASAKGTANGVAELDANGKVPSAQLPSFVDDVLEYENASSFPATGETGKIYVAKNTNKTYRWSGSEYVAIADGVALGETSSTAYRGDRGKTAYDHSQVTTGNPHNVSKTDVGLGNVDNTSDLDKPISTATQTALNGYVKSDASSRQTVSLNGAVPFAVRNKTAGHHRVYQSFETFADNSLGYIGVDNGTPKFLESDGTTEHVFAFSSDIPDMSYYRTSSAQDVIDNGKESTSNKVTSMSASSTDTQYPSAKAVYDAVSAKSVVSGTNDGTNWTGLTIDGVTKAISAGGGNVPEHLYWHNVTIKNTSPKINCKAYVFNSSPTAYDEETFFQYLFDLNGSNVTLMGIANAGIALEFCYASWSSNPYYIIYASKLDGTNVNATFNSYSDITQIYDQVRTLW